jgi:hypothetical protein
MFFTCLLISWSCFSQDINQKQAGKEIIADINGLIMNLTSLQVSKNGDDCGLDSNWDDFDAQSLELRLKSLSGNQDFTIDNSEFLYHYRVEKQDNGLYHFEVIDGDRVFSIHENYALDEQSIEVKISISELKETKRSFWGRPKKTKKSLGNCTLIKQTIFSF